MSELNKRVESPKKNRFPLYLQILTGMISGILIGFIALYFKSGNLVNDWVRPWGNLFIRLLQLIAVPLVFFSLLKGIMGIMDVSKFAKIGIRTVLIYLLTTFVAVMLGLSLGLIVKPGNFLNKGEQTSLMNTYSGVEKHYAEISKEAKAPLSFLNDIVPSNFMSAASDNSKIIQVIFFAILIGLAIIMLPSETMQPVVRFFDAFYLIMLKIVDLIIKTAPIGVAALMAGLVVDFSGQLSMFTALGIYALTTIFGLLLLMFGFYPY